MQNQHRKKEERWAGKREEINHSGSRYRLGQELQMCGAVSTLIKAATSTGRKSKCLLTKTDGRALGTRGDSPVMILFLFTTQASQETPASSRFLEKKKKIERWFAHGLLPGKIAERCWERERVRRRRKDLCVFSKKKNDAFHSSFMQKKKKKK